MRFVSISAVPACDLIPVVDEKIEIFPTLTTSDKWLKRRNTFSFTFAPRGKSDDKKLYFFGNEKKNFSFLLRLYPQQMAWRMLEEGRWLGRTTTQARTTFQNPKGWWSRFGKDIYHGIKSAGRNFANRIPVHAVGGWSASGGRRSQFRMVMVVAPIKPQVLA